MTTEEKKIELDKIAQEIKAFKELDIAKKATHAVPGEGDPDAQIMFIGEAPGQVEDSTGRPFVGQSGQLMRKTLFETTGIKPEEVFITNIVKFRPPDNRDWGLLRLARSANQNYLSQNYCYPGPFQYGQVYSGRNHIPNPWRRPLLSTTNYEL